MWNPFKRSDPAEAAKAELGYPLRSTPGMSPDGRLNEFQYWSTAGGLNVPIMRSPRVGDVTPNLLSRWPGPVNQIGKQFYPKTRGNSTLKSNGFHPTWDTLLLSPAYVPMGRVQQRQSVRYTGQSNFRPAGTFNVPAVFVPGSLSSFRGGLGKP